MPRRWRIPEGEELTVVRQLLQQGFEWPHDLAADTRYVLRTDDTDGKTNAPAIGVVISSRGSASGDAFLDYEGRPGEEIRVRTWTGGGDNPRANFALRFLALAIALQEADQEERVQLGDKPKQLGRKYRLPANRGPDAIRQLLSDGFVWPPELEADWGYQLQTDDTDGKADAPSITIMICDIGSAGGDAAVWFEGEAFAAIRIRSRYGGGRNPMANNALRILAMAIAMDQAERNQTRR